MQLEQDAVVRCPANLWLLDRVLRTPKAVMLPREHSRKLLIYCVNCVRLLLLFIVSERKVHFV